MLQPKGQAALGFIFVTLLVDVMGFGIIIPVLPQLIAHLIHGTISDAAPYAGLLALAYASMQFLCSLTGGVQHNSLAWDGKGRARLSSSTVFSERFDQRPACQG